MPVTTTLLAKGAFPETDGLSLGMLGMHGTSYANYVMMKTDLILAIGARFDDRITGRLDTFAPHAKIIHIDIDPAEIGKNVPVDVPIVGDAKKVLKELLVVLKANVAESGPPDTSAWHKQIRAWKKEYPLSIPAGGLRPQFVVDEIYRVTHGKATIVTDVGQHQMWSAQFYKCSKPRQFISSGGLGTMGFGLPAAIGAQVACPGQLVVDIAGDGSIQMTSQELATAVQYGLPVKVCIINNQWLGMVRQWQELFWNQRYSQTCMECQPDFVKLAEAYGAEGHRVTRPEDLEEVLRLAFGSPGQAVIDIRVKREANVYPMIPAGGTVHDMMERD